MGLVLGVGLLFTCWLLYTLLRGKNHTTQRLALCWLSLLVCAPFFYIAMDTPHTLWALCLLLSLMGLIILAATE